MNERIQELAEQARQYAIEKIKNSQDPAEWSTAVFEQKFAELIVRECVQVCNDVDAEYEGEDVLATWCARAIEEHFGVEE